ncbi:L-galactonate transporter [Auxenochlorella protothecoides]|uniref:L-galactonate transporter n=1 Tax=Auxenochlorella protothecoides TaxID=3075 RepID=A0A087SMI4_AUXPR|nr:L-galactonate transporter [Auxenochlorella protothecoides]KFM26938.1 L-galactonate transporter [Auxenochlorella protothecoides]
MTPRGRLVGGKYYSLQRHGPPQAFCHVGAQAPAPYNPIKPSCRPSLPATGARNVDTCAVKTLKKRRLPLNTTRSPLNGFNGTPEVLPAAQEAPNTPDASPWWMQLGPTWSLCVLTLAYLHHSTTGYALPALLPIISEDLHLVDTQAATLTAGYTVLYALAMLPLGIAADRVQSRPRLLAWGIAAWSLLTLGAARTHSFAELLAARVGFAGAQATQNPVCFALIPDLFPKNRTRAMALYNAAIYAGRALSFGVLMLAVKLGVPKALQDMRSLLSNRGFLALTGAAAVNDVGSWALVAWQGPFYQRVYDVGPEVYAPLLAVVIPVGGLLGGVGTGLAGDWLQRRGLGSLLTVGSNLAAAPVLAASMLMPDHRSSMAVLLLGFALSEAWRAPAAVALRDVSPPGRGAAASALHLCLRNLVGGVGPLAVAALAGRVGLQHAMLLVPGCFFTSGLGFWAVSRLNKAQAGR